MLALIELGVDRRIIKYHPEYFEENHIETVKEKMYDGENIKEYIHHNLSLIQKLSENKRNKMLGAIYQNK